MRAVTLDGDVFDPSGTLTGGSRSSANGNKVKYGTIMIVCLFIFFFI